TRRREMPSKFFSISVRDRLRRWTPCLLVSLSPCLLVSVSPCLLVLALAGCNSGTAPANGAKAPPPEVTVSAAITKTVTDYEDFPARMEGVNSVEIKARVTGYLEKINFKEGTDVEQGAVLFEI